MYGTHAGGILPNILNIQLPPSSTFFHQYIAGLKPSLKLAFHHGYLVLQVRSSLHRA
jgi:hypothetical protein